MIGIASLFIIWSSGCRLAFKPFMYVLDRGTNSCVDLHIVYPLVRPGSCIKIGYSVGLSEAGRWSEKELLTIMLVTSREITDGIHLKTCFSDPLERLGNPSQNVYSNSRIISRLQSGLLRKGKQLSS